MILLAIALGGALGAMGRFAVAGWCTARFRHSPVGTVIVNISGALALGIVVALAEHHIDMSSLLYRLVVIGILGSYTTFSTMFYETFILIETEKPTLALIYAAGSQLVGLLAVFLGMALVTVW